MQRNVEVYESPKTYQCQASNGDITAPHFLCGISSSPASLICLEKLTKVKVDVQARAANAAVLLSRAYLPFNNLPRVKNTHIIIRAKRSYLTQFILPMHSSIIIFVHEFLFFRISNLICLLTAVEQHFNVCFCCIVSRCLLSTYSTYSRSHQCSL